MRIPLSSSSLFLVIAVLKLLPSVAAAYVT